MMWTDRDNEALEKAWNAGKRVRDIARSLDRTDAEIRAQRAALGLRDRRKDGYDKDTWGGQIRAWPKLSPRAFA